MQPLIRIPEVVKLTGRSRASIYADMAAGRFPQSIKIGRRAIAWLQADIDAWLAERIAASRPEQGAS